MKKSGPKERTQRQHRVGELLRHAIADVLARGDIRDPSLQGVSVTVTEVTISPDLKNATAWVMPLGGEGAQDVEAGLNRCARYIRGQVGHGISLRYTPHIKFCLDYSFDQAAKVEALLNDPGVKRDLVTPSTPQPDDQ